MPDADFFGEDRIDYTIQDLLGATSSAEVSVTVTEDGVHPDEDEDDDPNSFDGAMDFLFDAAVFAVLLLILAGI